MLRLEKNRKVAAALALSGVITPVAGLHKFYLGQPVWGIVYLLLSWTPIPRVASAIEACWYLIQDPEQFDQNFNLSANSANWQSTPDVSLIADALRQLDQLRLEGLISEYEFEQKRRRLLDKIT